MLQFKPFLINKNILLASSLVFSCLFCLGLSSIVRADTIGVGVGTGKIELNEPLKPNLSYDLPMISVFNNGDVNSNYEITIEYNEVQEEQKPKAEWFVFSPKEFELAPGKAQQVAVSLSPEFSARPGKYFAYIEAHPIKKDESGNTAIRVAAATKLNFEVKPANLFLRVYYALLAFWNKYQEIIIVAITALSLALIVYIIRKNLNISIKRKNVDISSNGSVMTKIENISNHEIINESEKQVKPKNKPAKKSSAKPRKLKTKTTSKTKKNTSKRQSTSRAKKSTKKPEA